MKYPLEAIERRDSVSRWSVVDADRRIICSVNVGEWDWQFASAIVRFANRCHRWRKHFRPYLRSDWDWERNTRA